MRRELRSTDPNDPAAVAKALLERYKDSPQLLSLEQEAKGLPSPLFAKLGVESRAAMAYLCASLIKPTPKAPL